MAARELQKSQAAIDKLADTIAQLQSRPSATSSDLAARESARSHVVIGLIEMLREIEWAGTIWTDTAICLFCGVTRDGLTAGKKYPEQVAGQHKPECRWAAAVRNGDALTDESAGQAKG